MAWSKCHKNCVISGPLDAFCLVCESHLKSEVDLDAHFEKSIHKENLESAQYCEKYKDDRIRKVKRGYYCEFCNLLLFTTAKVGLHIIETQHKYNQSSHLLRRVNNSVIAFDNIFIDEKSWNGFVEDTCTICNTDLENENIHKADQNHILNLILKKVEFTSDKMVYRQIDDSSYQCLICNLVLASSTASIHVEEPDHINNLDKCCSLGSEIQNMNAVVKAVEKEEAEIKTEPLKMDTSMNKTELNDDNNKLPHKLNKTHGKLESKESKKPEVSVRLPTKDNIKNPGELEAFMCNVLGAKNYIVEHLNGKILCLLCDWSMNRDLIVSHVGGRHHLTILKMHKKRLEHMCNEIQEVKPKTGNRANDKTDDDTSKIIDSLTELKNNDIIVNFEKSLASCNKCPITMKLVYRDIQNHIQEHKKTEKQQEIKVKADSNNKSEPTKDLCKKPVLVKQHEEGHFPRANSVSPKHDDEQIEIFAKQNNLTYDDDGKMHCPLCNSKIPASLKSLKEHVIGAMHKKNKQTKNSETKNITSAPVLVKIPTQQFVTSLVGLITTLIEDIIVNEKFNISYYSFLMITSENGMLKCESCEVPLREADIGAHKITPSHVKAMTETMVITSFDHEFVREVRPNAFHCGYCAKVICGWDEFEKHLSTNIHRDKRTSAMWRLREHRAQSLVAREPWQRQTNFMDLFSRQDSDEDNNLH